MTLKIDQETILLQSGSIVTRHVAIAPNKT